MNYLIEQLEAAVAETAELISRESSTLPSEAWHTIDRKLTISEDLPVARNPPMSMWDEQQLMLSNDERNVHLFLMQQRNQIFRRMSQVQYSPNLKKASPNIVSPMKSAMKVPSSEKLKTPSESAGASLTAKTQQKSDPPFSDLPTMKLIDDTTTLLLNNLRSNALEPHAFVLTVTAMALDMPIKTIFHQIQFHSLSISIFFEYEYDERIKVLKLLKLLDQSCISTEQRRKLKRMFEEVSKLETEEAWTEFVRSCIHHFYWRHAKVLPIGDQTEARMACYEVDLQNFFPETSLSTRLIFFKIPTAKAKTPKHFLVPLLLPESHSNILSVSFLPGSIIIPNY